MLLDVLLGLLDSCRLLDVLLGLLDVLLGLLDVMLYVVRCVVGVVG